MKLELKHLAAYLPYGLKILRPDNKTSLRMIGLNGNLLILDEENTEKYGHITKNKPILHPLSDLTREIEVNAEKFIPMIKLLLSLNNGLINISTRSDNNNDIYVAEGWISSINRKYTLKFDILAGFIFEKNEITKHLGCDFDLYQELISWHFDIFGLIDAGLAINVNTLT